MGLPSGVLWSPVNVDDSQPFGFARSPYQYEGSFFSWGNIEAHHPTTEERFDYNWGGVNTQAPYYEGQPYGLTPGSLIQGNLSLEQDAAHQICGGLWRMPSSDEFQELLDNCMFVDVDGVEIPGEVVDKRISYPLPDGTGFVVGIRLKSRINGAVLFFAASGDGFGRNWVYRGQKGFYWSSTFSNAQNSNLLSFDNSAVPSVTLFGRYCGFPIRPVMLIPSE